jgi:hypothetical protein
MDTAAKQSSSRSPRRARRGPRGTGATLVRKVHPGPRVTQEQRGRRAPPGRRDLRVPLRTRALEPTQASLQRVAEETARSASSSSTQDRSPMARPRTVGCCRSIRTRRSSRCLERSTEATARPPSRCRTFAASLPITPPIRSARWASTRHGNEGTRHPQLTDQTSMSWREQPFRASSVPPRTSQSTGKAHAGTAEAQSGPIVLQFPGRRAPLGGGPRGREVQRGGRRRGCGSAPAQARSGAPRHGAVKAAAALEAGVGVSLSPPTSFAG